MSAADVVVGEFRKNNRESVRISLGSFKGHETLDVRVVIGSGPGAVVTRKGLTLRRELLPDLAAALNEACTAAGLSTPPASAKGSAK
jgi:hypothetical protein